MEYYLKKELYELIIKDDSIIDRIFESSLEGLWFWDLDKPENEWMDSCLWETLGYEHFDNKNNLQEIQNIIDPNDLRLALENLNKHIKDPSIPYNQVVRFKHKNGSTVWIECRGVAIRNKEGKPSRMIGLHHDITKSRELEHELNSFFSLVPDLICIASIDGNFLKVNQSWEKVLGYSEAELLSKSAEDLLHPDDLQFSLNECRKVLNGAPSVKFVNRYRHKNGSYKLLEWVVVSSPDKKNLYAAAKSISEKKRLMEELMNARNKAEESERSYRMFIDQSKEGIYRMEIKPPMPLNLDTEQMVEYLYEHSIIVECNKSMIDMYCLSDPNEIIGKRLVDFHGNNSPENRESIKNYILAGFRIDNEKTVEKDKNGKLHYFLNSSTGFIENGFLVRSWGTQLDITEKHIYEAELLKAKVKAEESDRLKTAFLQNMSHEVRTPLNVIAGFSKLLTEKEQSPDDLRTYSRMIEASSDKLVRIITDVIEISQLQAGQVRTIMSETDVEKLINKIFLSFTDNAQEKNIEFVISLRIQGSQSLIMTDSAKLEKLFTHLIDNAIKFTHKGAVKVSSEIENGFLLFSVSDTGIGISSETRKIIFEPFRQLETELSRNYGGNGLGLALVKAYTELLNGTLTLKSEIGRGTTVLISIPLNNSDFIHKEQKESLHEDAFPSKVSTILIAEDEYSNYLYLREILRGESIKVIHAKNGKEAIDLCRDDKEISLILMDIKMPVMDGNTAASMIKSFRPGLPIIAQTAYADSNMANFIGTFDDIIVKPVKKTELKEKLGRFLG